MPVRKIEARLGMRKIGMVRPNPTSTKAKEIDAILVYPEHGTGMMALQVETPGPGSKKSKQVVALSFNAAMEVVKGILQNMHEFSVAADDELQSILKEKLAFADREARQAVAAVTERYSAPEIQGE
jgi:hypothetical protein